jgi:hypothetical protein
MHLILGGGLVASAIAVNVAACGDNRYLNSTDASGRDAKVNSADLDASYGMVTVRYRLPPKYAGATVIFQNVDGAVAAMGPFNVDGYARARVENGGSVTVIVPDPQGGRFLFAHTTMGVEDGDEIWQGRKGASYDQEFVRFILPPAYGAPWVFTNCHEWGTQGVLVRWPLDCPKMASIVVAETSPDHREFAYVPAITKPASGELLLADLVFHRAEPAHLRLVNIPPQIQNVISSVVLSDGVAITRLGYRIGNSLVSSGTADVTVDYARVPGTFPLAFVTFSDGTYRSSVALSLGDSNQDIDVGNAIMPWLTSEPHLDARHATVSWTQTEWGKADGVLVQFKNKRGFNRYVLAQHTGSSLQVPPLPPPFDDFNVQRGDTALEIQADFIGDSEGYRGVRNWVASHGGYFGVRAPGGYFGYGIY